MTRPAAVMQQADDRLNAQLAEPREPRVGPRPIGPLKSGGRGALPQHGIANGADAERAAVTPRPPKGLDFRKYVTLYRGMSEGEFITVAGEPDLLLWDSGPVKTYTYFPTPGDPFTTTVVLRSGRVAEIERVRKF